MVQNILASIRRQCPRASRSWRSTLYRRAKISARRGHVSFHTSSAESWRQTQRRSARRVYKVCPSCNKWRDVGAHSMCFWCGVKVRQAEIEMKEAVR